MKVHNARSQALVTPEIALQYLKEGNERFVNNLKANRNLMPMQPGDVAATHADCSLLENLTGYRPQVRIEEGVKEFVRWYRKFYQL